MADTTIKVSSDVRDRLALVAAEQGVTMRALVEQLAASLLTGAEREVRRKADADYIREHLRPSLDEVDLAEGERIWRELEAEAAKARPSKGYGGQAA